MKTSKYIEFKNVADLAAKLEKLIAYREKSLLESRNWLIANNVPYQVLHNGDLILDTGDLDKPELAEAAAKFKEKLKITQEYYKSLGVVYLETFETQSDLTYDGNRYQN